MKENNLELSNFFWNSYKLFLKEKLSLNELKMALTTADDVVFYKNRCDLSCDVQKLIKRMIARELDVFVEELLFELEDIPTRRERKAIMQKFLVVLLGFDAYPSKVGGEIKTLCDEVSNYFAPSIPEISDNKRLDENLHSLIRSMASASNHISEEEVVEPILCKLALIYSCLATSDREGAMKCKKLAKLLFTNVWFKTMPELVTLSYLKKEHSLLPVSEFELLERYSFWKDSQNQKMEL